MHRPIVFSTLACPQWTREQVVANATAFGYDGIEWRGGPHGHVQPGLSQTERAALKRRCLDGGVRSVALTAYTTLVADDPAERRGSVEQLRRYCELAADLDARLVRVFLGRWPPGRTLDQLYGRATESLAAAADYARRLDIMLAVEPHDEFVHSGIVAPLLQRLQHPAVGVVWDIGNTAAVDEAQADSVRLLGPALCHVHIKDGVGSGSTWRCTRLGEGRVQLLDGLKLLLSRGYDGALSIEWERPWQPDLDPPELALPAALATLRYLLANAIASHPAA